MINYEEKLKELRFNFRPEEIIDYETLISLIASLFSENDAYEQNKEELFHTLQILVLVYGLEDQIMADNFVFDQNNINTGDINLWKYLVVELYNDLEKTNEFLINDATKNKVMYVLNILDGQIPQLEELNKTDEPEINLTPSDPIEKDNLDVYNWDYLSEYVRMNKILPYKCACCGLEEWQGKPLKLILSKKDRSSGQNIDNIYFLCPNCYSQIGK